MRVTAFSVPPSDNTAYLVVDESSLEAAVIDPALGSKKILEALKLAGATVKFIVNTHGHPDHTADDAPLKAATGAKLAIHELDANRLEMSARDARPTFDDPLPLAKPDLLLKEGTGVRLGSTLLVTMHAPGHTEGSVVFYEAAEGVLFSGDTVLQGTSGRTDVRGGSPAKMVASLRRLYRDLPPDTRVLPGHGRETTLRDESWIADLAYPVVR
ncbi:MAG: hypothetical protein A3K65_09330 [Euryarchaeota archaeon RBG_16_68_12]|nr:MAG: hypothetical protein A3K65_09330 [Euryarchaeota archaeon RBG_16_68_12]